VLSIVSNDTSDLNLHRYADGLFAILAAVQLQRSFAPAG
jgi:hypothetical protein